MIKRQLELCEIPDAHARTLLDRHATQIAQPWLILRRVQRAMEDLAEEFRRNETADRSLVLYVKRTTSPPHLPRAIYWGRFLSAERAKTSTGEKVSLIEHLGDRLMKGWMSKYASGHELYPRFKAYEPRASALNQARAALKGATKSIRATLRNRYEGAPPFPSPGHPLLDILPADGASALRHSWAVMAWLAAVWRDLNNLVSHLESSPLKSKLRLAVGRDPRHPFGELQWFAKKPRWTSQSLTIRSLNQLNLTPPELLFAKQLLTQHHILSKTYRVHAVALAKIIEAARVAETRARGRLRDAEPTLAPESPGVGEGGPPSAPAFPLINLEDPEP